MPKDYGGGEVNDFDMRYKADVPARNFKKEDLPTTARNSTPPARSVMSPSFRPSRASSMMSTRHDSLSPADNAGRMSQLTEVDDASQGYYSRAGSLTSMSSLSQDNISIHMRDSASRMASPSSRHVSLLQN